MKKTTFTLLLSLYCCWLAAQCPTNLQLLNQSQVTQIPIQYPNCDSINGYLHIGPSNDITDLSPLLVFRSVEQDIVIKGNTALTSLAGLDSLRIFGQTQPTPFSEPDSLVIQNNDRLTNLQGLGNPATKFGKSAIFALVIAENDSLLNLNGLEAYAGSGGHILSFDYPLRRGGLTVFHNKQLANLNGLEGMTFGIADILNNDQLTQLEGLGKVDFLTVSGNGNLPNLHGLEHLTSIASLKIEHNSKLEDLTGLEQLAEVKGLFGYPSWGLFIHDNDKLQDLKGLDILKTVVGHLSLRENLELMNLNGLDSLQILGECNLTIVDNPNLLHIEALSGIETIGYECQDLDYCIGGNVFISNNPLLTNLNGLHQLDSLWSLTIEDNDQLTSLNGLNDLKIINASLVLTSNDILGSLGGLENLQIIGGGFKVVGNFTLKNLDPLTSLISVGADYDGYLLSILLNPELENLNGFSGVLFSETGMVDLSGNSKLAICDNSLLCAFLNNGGTATITSNAPGCNNIAEVESACMVSIEETSNGEPFILFSPNPVGDFLQIQVTDNEKWEIGLFDLQGTQMFRQSISGGKTIFVKGWPSGIYTIHAISDERIFTGKISKQ